MDCREEKTERRKVPYLASCEVQSPKTYADTEDRQNFPYGEVIE